MDKSHFLNDSYGKTYKLYKKDGRWRIQANGMDRVIVCFVLRNNVKDAVAHAEFVPTIPHPLLTVPANATAEQLLKLDEFMSKEEFHEHIAVYAPDEAVDRAIQVLHMALVANMRKEGEFCKFVADLFTKLNVNCTGTLL
jgi:hypothetical protein